MAMLHTVLKVGISVRIVMLCGNVVGFL